MTLESRIEKLTERTEHSRAFRPTLFRLDRPGDREALTRLLDEGQVAAAHDHIEGQLRELLTTRSPGAGLTLGRLDEQVRAHLGGVPASAHGTWVFFPWSRQLVHVLPEAEYRELRSARNRYKITPEEQELLRARRIGVVGLSVGQAIALTLALEGVGGSYRLADFDAVELSNMNRLRASIADLGTNKAVVAARQMFEIDPYLDIEIFEDGLRADNVDAFLTGGGKLDLLLEECDDLFIKLFVRERARAHRIPVLMETNDRGLLDIERFDLEPDRPAFHGLIGGITAGELQNLSTREKVPYVLRIVGRGALPPRTVASLLAVQEQRLSSWPQLASAVAHGAALSTEAARRVLLGDLVRSGRYSVDLETLIHDDRADLCAVVVEAPSPPPLVPEEAPALVWSDRSGESGVSRDDVRRVVTYGTLAPSGGNMQPWRFVARGASKPCVRCLVDQERATTLLDFEMAGSHVALGAAVENMDLAARGLGLCAEIAPFPVPGDARVVCDVSLSPSTAPEPSSPLLPYVAQRVTNRRHGRRAPLAPEQAQALGAAAESAGARLQLVEDPSALQALGEVLGAGDRFRFLCERLFHEMIGEVRWTREDAARTRDGLDVPTLELSPGDLTAMRLLRSFQTMRLLGQLGIGRALEASAHNAWAATSAAGFLTFPGDPQTHGPSSYFAGGRAMQRVWLTAQSLGLAFQPWGAILYIFAAVERGCASYSEAEVRAVRGLRERFARIFEVRPGTAEIMLFRLGHADPPTARSLRRPVDEVLVFDEAP